MPQAMAERNGPSLVHESGALRPAAWVRVEIAKGIDGALEFIVRLAEDAARRGEPDRISRELVRMIGDEMRSTDRELEALEKAGADGGVRAGMHERRARLAALRDLAAALPGAPQP